MTWYVLMLWADESSRFDSECRLHSRIIEAPEPPSSRIRPGDEFDIV